MPRVLLILPTATYRAPDFLAAARALGVEVIVGSEQPQAMAGSMGDRSVVVPLEDPEAAVEAVAALHGRSPLDAVVAVDDQGVVIAAKAAARLGLPHNPLDAVAATRDKAAMRRAFAAAGVPQPRFEVIDGEPTASVGFRPGGRHRRGRPGAGDGGRAAPRRGVRAWRRGRGRGPAARRAA